MSDFLFHAVSSLPISLFRIFFALLMLQRIWVTWDIYRFFQHDTCHFSFFSWLKPFKALQYLQYIRAMAFLGVLFGVPFSASISCILFFYFLFLDKALYTDAQYLQGIFLFLLALTDSNASLSVVKSSINLVPYWQVFIFQFQIALVFFYKALAKLQKDWLWRQEPLKEYLKFFVMRRTDKGRANYRLGGRYFAENLHALFNHHLFLKTVVIVLPLLEFGLCPLVFYPTTHVLGLSLYFGYCVLLDLFAEQQFIAYENYLYGIFLLNPMVIEKIYQTFGAIL